MVVRDVAEDGTGKTHTGNAVLHHSVTTHLHEGIAASGIHHLAQQLVEL